MSPKNKEQNWQLLRELALNTPYTMGYLSLMARRKQLKVKKIGRVWHSTMENIKDFEEQMKERKEQRKRQLQESYREKVKREVLKEIEEESDQLSMDNLPAGEAGEQEASHTKFHTPPPESDSGYSSPEETSSNSPLERGAEATPRRGVLSSDDTIFDEVQKELEEVLQEIRDREKKLRQDYLAYRGIHGDDGVEVYGNAALAREKQETEELSEKLIMDLGRLLNTANKIHEEEESAEPADTNELDPNEGISIPVRNKNIQHGSIRTMGMDFKRADNQFVNLTDPPAGRAGKTVKRKHKDNFLSVPYSTFPFEHGGFKTGGLNQREERLEPTSMKVSAQNKLLLFISGLLVFIAAVLIVLVIFG
ncbi:MAG: hypothetical protein V1690_00160 [Candidatus Moraniibacteriota bacterium]